MKKGFIVFKFEFLSYIKNKVFIGITLFLIVLVGVVLSLPRFSEIFSNMNFNAEVEDVVIGMDNTDIENNVIAISGVDATVLEYIQKAMSSYNFKVVEDSIDTIKADVESQKYHSAIILTGELSYQYIVKDIAMYDSTQNIFEDVLLQLYQANELVKLGANNQTIMNFMSAIVQSEVVQVESGKDQMQNFFYTYILIFALYMAIMLYGQFVSMSVATEKSSRAMELLVTSAKPEHLMFGKILGVGSVGILQFTAIFGSAYLFYNINSSLYEDNGIINSIFNMPLEILLFAILFFVLGFFIYAFMYGALGSLVSRIEQLNTSSLPVTFLFIFAFMVVIFSMSSGKVDSVLMIVVSFIPFTSPMAMFVRIAMGNVQTWEILLSVGILLVSVIGIGYLASGIYRLGVLMYGQPPKIKEIFRLMKTKGENI